MTTILIIISILVGTFIIKAIIKTQRLQDNKKGKDGSENKSVSWEFIESNFGWAKNRAPHMKCPNCGLKSDNLDWFKFRTSDDSWKHLAGSEGFYSKCPNCKIMVDEIVTKMN